MNILERALIFAVNAHEGQTRKKENIPFILHPAEAAAISATLTDDREVMAAVALHDTVEDTDTTIEEIRAEFGDSVAELVAGETEEAFSDLPKSESWRKRKEISLKHLRECGDVRVKIMWLSDKLANMRAFYRLYLSEGEKLWDGFNQKDPAVQEWYYRSIAEAVDELSDTLAYKEYVKLLDLVFSGGQI